MQSITLFILNSALLGVGLAMDAFSVSLANGLAEPAMNRRRMAVIAGVYAGFQFLMPVLGWLAVTQAIRLFESFRPFIPWVELILLCWIGGTMLLEGIRDRSGKKEEETAEEEKRRGGLTAGTLFLQGVATSIDALSVGFTIAEYDWKAALCASLIIAAVTFALCMGGLRLGKTFGTKLAGRASILGGCILIAIGIEIFVKSLL